MSFLDLPVELLPFIIQHLLIPHHIAQACLVNKDFYACAVPLLYERTAIFSWHREGKKRVTKLLWTLANCPHLARHVRRLELRDFPKAIYRDSKYELTQLCIAGLANCVNLISCTWTRDGSLNDNILEALSRCPSLEALEINGRHAHNYDPSLLDKFTNLRKISLIMPSLEVVHTLPGCFQQNFETLQELTIICKFTSTVTDNWLQSMAPALCRLKKLHLAGCPKVTHHGIIHLLGENTTGIMDLALEGVSPSFDMRDFAVSSSHSLSRLTSITLTFPVVNLSYSWTSSVELLLFDALSLQQFHLYASGGLMPRPMTLDAAFIWRFMDRHKERLTRFAVLQLPMSILGLEKVVGRAERLEQLFVSVWKGDLNNLGPVIAQSRTLRTVHITYAFQCAAGHHRLDSLDDDGEDGDLSMAHTGSGPPQSLAGGTQNTRQVMAGFEALASQFGGNVTQFGVQTRVWQVERVFTTKNGEPIKRVRLAPYESPDVPDVFLVVRT